MMDKYDEMCLEVLVEKDPEISVLEFNLIEQMFDCMGVLFIFLEPDELVDVFLGQKYIKDELANKILDRRGD